MFLASLNFNDFFFFINPCVLLTFLWVYFFKINSNTVRVGSGDTTNVSVIKTNPNPTFVGFYILSLTLAFFITYTIHGKNCLVWFDHFNISNFSLYLLYSFILVGFSMYFLLNCIFKKTNSAKSIDYLFSINNLIILLPYLFFVNTIFTFLFFLELVSAILLYKLISSKLWFKNVSGTKYLNNQIPQNYINMVFFQYWVTFFATIFIIYFYINIFYIYGTSDWFTTQFLGLAGSDNNFAFSNLLRVLIIIFIFSVFFKLGITPFHLFKIEVYKGIPFLSIFFLHNLLFYSFFYLFLIFTFWFFSDFCRSLFFISNRNVICWCFIYNCVIVWC